MQKNTAIFPHVCYKFDFNMGAAQSHVSPTSNRATHIFTLHNVTLPAYKCKKSTPNVCVQVPLFKYP